MSANPQTGHVFNRDMGSKCPVTRGEVDLDYYAQRDVVWRAMKIAAPARRALVNASLLKLADLKKISRTELAQLHGMGPTALTILDSEMKAKNWHYK